MQGPRGCSTEYATKEAVAMARLYQLNAKTALAATDALQSLADALRRATIIASELEKLERLVYEPDVPNRAKFEQRRWDRERAQIEYRRQTLKAERHFQKLKRKPRKRRNNGN